MKKVPKWFNLNNYLQPMSNEEWAYHIYVRSKIFVKGSFRDWRSCREIFSILKRGNFSEKSLLESVRDNFSINFADAISRDLKGFRASEQPITILSIAETVTKANELVNELHYEEFKPYGDDRPKSQFDEAMSDIRQTFEESIFGSNYLISCSLDHTDTEIIKAVREHLKKTRLKSQKMYIFSGELRETLQEFHQFRLLALFDLLYWKEFEDPKLSYAVIGAAIWPDHIIEIDQRIRKKGKPLIERVFHREIAQKIYRNQRVPSA